MKIPEKLHFWPSPVENFSCARTKVILGFNFYGLALICQTLCSLRFISHQTRSNTKIGRFLWHFSHFMQREIVSSMNATLGEILLPFINFLRTKNKIPHTSISAAKPFNCWSISLRNSMQERKQNILKMKYFGSNLNNDTSKHIKGHLVPRTSNMLQSWSWLLNLLHWRVFTILAFFNQRANQGNLLIMWRFCAFWFQMKNSFIQQFCIYYSDQHI